MNEFCAGIHVLIKKDNKYLLLKRSDHDKDDPGCWDLPGGGIDWGEQPQEAAVRETKEEAGLEIKVTQILSLQGMQYGGKWSIESIAEGEYLLGEVSLSEEHSESKWVTREEFYAIEPKGEHLVVIAKTLKNYPI